MSAEKEGAHRDSVRGRRREGPEKGTGQSHFNPPAFAFSGQEEVRAMSR